MPEFIKESMSQKEEGVSPLEESLSPKEAGGYVGESERTLANKRSLGTGPAYLKTGGRIFYFKKDLDAYLKIGFRPAGMGNDYVSD